MARTVVINMILRDKVSRNMAGVRRSVQNTNREFKNLSKASQGLNQVMDGVEKGVAKPIIKLTKLAAVGNVAASSMSALAAAGSELISSLGPTSAAIGGVATVISGALLQGLIVGKLAFANFGKAIAGNKKAMQRLGDSGRVLAKELINIKKKLSDVATAHVFGGLSKDITQFSASSLPMLKKAVAETGDVLNAFIKRALHMAETPLFQKNFATITSNNAKILGNLGDAFLNIVPAIMNIVVVMQPMTIAFTKWLKISANTISNLVEAKKKSGELAKFFKRASDITAEWGRILANIAVALFNTFKAGSHSAQTFQDSLERVTKRWRNWTGSLKGQNALKKWFEDGNRTLSAFGKLIGALGGALKNAFSGIDVAGLADEIRTKIVPPLEHLMANVGKSGLFKALADAMGNWLGILAKISDSGSLKTIADGLKAITGWLRWMVTNVPGVSTILSTLFLGVIAKSIAKTIGLKDAVSGLAKMIGALNGAIAGSSLLGGGKAATLLKGGPITALVLLVVGLELALGALASKFREVRGPILAVLVALGPLGVAIAATVAIQKNFAGVTDYLKRSLRDMWYWLGPQLSSAGKQIAAVWNSQVVPAWNQLKKAVDDALRPLGGTSSVMHALGIAARVLGVIIIAVFVGAILGTIKAVAFAVTTSLLALSIVLKSIAFVVRFVAKTVQDTWNGIKFDITQACKIVSNAVSVSFNFIKNLNSNVCTFILNVIRSTWHFIVVSVQNSTLLLKIAFFAIVGWIHNQLNNALNFLKNTFHNTWNIIAAIAASAWHAILGTWNKFVGFIHDQFFHSLHFLQNTFHSVWNGITNDAHDAWFKHIKPIFDAIVNTVKNVVPNAFKVGKAAIGKIWEGLKLIVWNPVKYMIDLYNNGILGFVDKIGSFVGQKGLKSKWHLNYPRFATGGVLPGYSPGHDNMTLPAYGFSGGEAIMRPEFTRVVGDGFVHGANDAAVRGGTRGVADYLAGQIAGGASNGGIVGGQTNFDIGGIISSIGSGVKNAAGSIGKIALEALAKSGVIGLAKKMVTPLINQLPNNLPPMVRDITKTTSNWIFDFFESKWQAQQAAGGGWVGDASLQKALAWARTQEGKPYQWGGGGNPSWDCSGFTAAIECVMNGRSPGRLWTTSSFNGASAPAGWVQNLNSPYRVGVTTGHMAGTLLGHAVESSGSGRGVHVDGVARGADHPMFNRRYGYKPAIAHATPVGGAGGGGGNAVFTSYWDSGQASGRPMSSTSIASSYIPLDSWIGVNINGKSTKGRIDDLGPAKFVYDRHPGKAVFDLNELMMQSLTGSRSNVMNGSWSLISVGGGRTLYGKNLRGYERGGIMEHANNYVNDRHLWGRNAPKENMLGFPGGHGLPPIGKVNRFDAGGFLMPGHIGLNTSNHPEPVFSHSQWESISELVDMAQNQGNHPGPDHVHLHIGEGGHVYVKSERDMENMIATAIANLKRKKKI